MVVLAIGAACGSGSAGSNGSNAFEKISDTGTILTIGDIEATGWKRSKAYDVEGLTGADAAYLGFWTPPGLGSLNYEVRVYPSHQAAVELGTAFAEEASGEDAVLDADDATWSEGVSDRRIIVGGGSRGSQNPRYGDYVIISNLVILCEGRTAEHSRDQCAALVALVLDEGA